MLRRARVGRNLLGLVIAGALWLACSAEQSESPQTPEDRSTASAAVPGAPEPIEHLSLPVLIRSRIASMAGPFHTARVKLGRVERPELLWITGYRVRAVDDAGRSASNEFICHNNLAVDAEAHAKNFGGEKNHSSRLFTLSQGVYAADLPTGFGIPLFSSEKTRVNAQVLNLNHDDPNIRVGQLSEIDVVRDEDLESPLKPLFTVPIFIMAMVEGEHGVYNVSNPGAEHGDSSCLPGEAPTGFQGNFIFGDISGQKFTGHWVLPKGREVRHTLVTSMLDLKFDTRIHFISIHLHPHAVSLALRDVTTDETLWTAYAKTRTDGIGLEHVDSFSSEEGIPLYKDHDYELVSVYDKSSDEPGDAMATMNVYMADVETEEKLDRIRQKLSWARGAYSPAKTSRP